MICEKIMHDLCENSACIVYTVQQSKVGRSELEDRDVCSMHVVHLLYAISTIKIFHRKSSFLLREEPFLFHKCN